MKVCLVARDIAPSNAFEKLKQALIAAGHAVNALLGMGKPPTFGKSDIEAAMKESDIVVVGMSSSKELAEPEIAACTFAWAAGKPFGFYGDTFHCHERAGEGCWFAPFAEGVSFFFAINEGEADSARKLFVNAQCVATGNPMWESYGTP